MSVLEESIDSVSVEKKLYPWDLFTIKIGYL